MLAHHRGLQITPEQRHRFASTMSLAAAGRRPGCRRTRSSQPRIAIGLRIEWGTRLAMHNSQPDAEGVAEHAPVPRWGWGVAPPYTG